jgi:cytochrome c556
MELFKNLAQVTDRKSGMVYAHEWDQEKLQNWDDDIQEIKDTARLFFGHVMQGSDGGRTTATAAAFAGAAGARGGSAFGPAGSALGAVGGAVGGAVTERGQACVSCHITSKIGR